MPAATAPALRPGVIAKSIAVAWLSLMISSQSWYAVESTAVSLERSSLLEKVVRQSLFSVFQWLAAWKLCSLPMQAMRPFLHFIHREKNKSLNHRTCASLDRTYQFHFTSHRRDLSTPSLRTIAALRENPLYFPTIFWRFLEKREFPHLVSNACHTACYTVKLVLKQRSEENIWILMPYSWCALLQTVTKLESVTKEHQGPVAWGFKLYTLHIPSII